MQWRNFCVKEEYKKVETNCMSEYNKNNNLQKKSWNNRIDSIRKIKL